MIACIGKNRELGKDNKLLWSIPEDMQRFKKLTSGHAVIMGQNTFESIGKALSNRTNVVLTRDKNFKPENCEVCYSIDEAIEAAKRAEKEEIFIIGGGQIYKQLLPLSDKLYLTIVEQEKQADTFFPDYSDFSVIKKIGSGQTREGLKYEFLELTKNA